MANQRRRQEFSIKASRGYTLTRQESIEMHEQGTSNDKDREKKKQ